MLQIKKTQRRKKKAQTRTLQTPPRLASPPLGHLNRLLPRLEPSFRFLISDLGLKNGPALRVDILEVTEVLPDSHGETGRDGGAKSRCFPHGWSIDRDANKIRLRL